jgi:hypothetical protein
MTIPANVTSELANLQSQVAAATPLSAASLATLTAIQLNAAQLAADIGAALTNAAGALDTWTAPADPVAIINGVNGLIGNASDQASLSNMQGYVMRAAKNLNQLV